MGADRIRGRRGAAGYYDVMSVKDICRIGGPGTIAGFNIAENAHLYLWTTNAFMEDAHVIARHWGFTVRTILTWVKPQIGMGHYFRNNTEHALFAVRGRLDLKVKNQPTSFTAPRRRHSQKPDEFFQIVERCSPGPYVELFARLPRENWKVWGNEVPAEC